MEQQLSDRHVELADAETVAQCVADLRDLLNESSLAERKTFIRSFVKEVKVTGDEALLTYTIPMLPRGVTEEKLPVLSIVHHGGLEGNRTRLPNRLAPRSSRKSWFYLSSRMVTLPMSHWPSTW
jgi:hypothetical protein